MVTIPPSTYPSTNPQLYHDRITYVPMNNFPLKEENIIGYTSTNTVNGFTVWFFPDKAKIKIRTKLIARILTTLIR